MVSDIFLTFRRIDFSFELRRHNKAMRLKEKGKNKV